MARTNLGKIVMIPKGTYSTTVTYSKLDVVTSNGSGYISKSDNNLNKPLTNETYWMKLVEKGDKGDKGDSYIITEADIQEIEDYVVDKTSGQIIATRKELERVKNDVLETGTDTDTFIHVEDSAMAELQEIKVDGVCEQNTTQGYNLINYSLLINEQKTYTVGGITMSYSEDGTLTANGTQTTSWLNFFSKNITDILEDGKTYTLWAENYSVDLYSNSFYAQIEKTNNETGKLEYIYLTKKNLTFIVDKTKYSKYVFHINLADKLITLTNFKNKFMLYKGTDEKVYELYTGGQPSPSPDYPQEIKTITDSLKITSCGKNLVERMVLGELNTETGIFEQSSTVICNERYIPYDSLKQYYIKVDNAPGTANIRWYNQKLEYIGYGTTQSSGMINKSVNTELTSSVPSDTTPKYFKIRKADATLLNSTWCVSTDSNYFGEYIESQIQAKLPEGEFIGKINDTYKDTLRAEYNKDDGQYHLILDKMVGYKKFIGATDESWTQLQFKLEIFQISVNSIYMLPSTNDKGTVLSNYLITANPNAQWMNNLSCITNLDNEKMIRVRFKDNPFSTVAEYKNWLSTHNLDAYYALETPYKIDLGPIDMPLTYDEITNIFTDSDLLPIINAKYYRNFITTIQNLQVNEKALKQELADINTRLSALESANTNVASESEVTE